MSQEHVERLLFDVLPSLCGDSSPHFNNEISVLLSVLLPSFQCMLGYVCEGSSQSSR